MKLYHTSTQLIEKPDTQHSRAYIDFGKGFYLTSIREQAEKYATRFIKRGKEAYINIYELDDISFNTFKTKNFEAYNEEWLDYVAACRRGEPVEVYDMVSGGIADDSVFDTIDLYFSGIYAKEQALGKLIYEKPNHQICILTQKILSEHLHFIEANKI